MKIWIFRLAVGVPLASMLAIMIYDYRKFEKEPPCHERASTLDAFNETSITMLHDIGQLLLSIGFLILGGIGVLAYRTSRRSGKFNSPHVVALVAAFACVLTSIYFGYVADIRLVEELLAHCREVGSDAFWWSHSVQYYSLLGSGLMLFLALVLPKKDKGEGVIS